MDPISASILAAIAAGAAAGVTKTASQAVVDGYGSLKQLLKRKFGADSDVVGAVNAVETKPESAARQSVLKEEIAAADAVSDPELLQQAQALLKHLNLEPQTFHVSQTAVGNNNIQVAGSHDTVNVNPKS